VAWWAIVVSVLLLATAAFAVNPIWNAATHGPVAEARLAQPPAYLAIAPFANILDVLTLLTVGQHIAVGLWAIGIYAAIRVWRARRARTMNVRREALAAVAFFFGLFVVYAIGATAPRPMAQLVVTDETVLSADFHAHTKYSHDGRAGWDENDVRAWHRGAGFDVAYITDHRTFEGAERGIAGNASQAGQAEGTMLLQGLEAVLRGQHVLILSAGRRYRGITTPDLRDVDEQGLVLASLVKNNEPVVIQTIPDDLSKTLPAGEPSTAGVRALELIDGSPRGLSQGRRERARILRLSDSLDLALVAGSDNHGWGRTAPGWTLLRIRGWRGMSTDSLAMRIESVLRLGRNGSTLVVERRVADGINPLALAFASVVIPWRMLTTLSTDERVVWLIWTWAIVLIARGLRLSRLRPSRAA
jgi:predicted metal-dependent phosphoesterase TrpH